MKKFIVQFLVLFIFYTKIITPCCTIINSPIATITAVTEPHGVRFSPNGSCLAVSDSVNLKIFTTSGNCSGFNNTNPIAVIDNGTTTVGSTVSASFSNDGSCIAVSNIGTTVNSGWVRFYASTGGCIGFNNATSIASLNTGSPSQVNQPSGTAYSPTENCFFVGNESGGTKSYPRGAAGCAGFNGATATTFTSTLSRAIKFHPSGTCMVGVGGNAISFYNFSGSCSSLSTAAVINGPITSDFRGIAYLGDGSCIAVSDSNATSTINIYSSSNTSCAGFSGATPTTALTIPDRIFEIDVSPDGTCLAVAKSGLTSGQTPAVVIYPILSSIITASGPTNLCAGESVTLNAFVQPTVTYQWRRDGVNIVGATSAAYNASSTGSYTVIATANGCSLESNSIDVNVLSATITPAGPITICSGQSVTLNANNVPGAVYQWLLNGTNIPLATNPSYNATQAGSYTVTINTIDCGATSNPVVVTVNTSPIATNTAAGSTTFCAGGSVILNANTGANLTYQWQNNGINIVGSTGSSYTAITSGSYTVVVTSTTTSCSSTSNAITVTVNPTPTATITPLGPINLCTGQTVTLNANTGVGLTYQWQNNGINIGGATSSSYIATATGLYTVVVSNGSCNATSTAVSVTINSFPTATISPAGPTTFCAGQSVILNANTGTNLNYQWQNNGTNIPGAIGSSYVATIAGSYTVVVTPGGTTCSTTSSPVVVTVNAVPAAVVSPTGPISICVGQTVTLNANTGTGLTYQWLLNGSNISGATSDSYIPIATGSYSVIISNTSCSATSNVVSLTINQLPDATITSSGPITFCAGESVILNANTGANLAYQWQVNGTNISGANTSSYTATTAGNYTVIVTSTTTTCNATSNPITITVNPLPTATITPAGPINLCAGQTITLNANTGSGLTYQWQLNGNNILGAINDSYTPTASGSYTVIINNGLCDATSNAVLVTINPMPDAIITPAGPTIFCAGNSVILNANIGTNLTYQWQRDSINILGETASSYVATEDGNYTVIVTSTSTTCNAVSSSVTVTVNPLPAAMITPAGSINLCAGQFTTLYANTGIGLTYQWQQNGLDIPGATSNSYVVNTAGSYAVIVTSANDCSTISAAVIVIINPTPEAIISPLGPISICQGQSVQLNANIGIGLSYQWLLNGVDIADAINNSYLAKTTGSYTVLVTTNAGCSTLSNVVDVIVNPLPVATIAAVPNRIAPGDSAVLVATPTIGTAPFQIIWSDGVVQDNVIISADRTVQPATTTEYSFVVIDANGCESDPGNTIKIVVCNKPDLMSPLCLALYGKYCNNC